MILDEMQSNIADWILAFEPGCGLNLSGVKRPFVGVVGLEKGVYSSSDYSSKFRGKSPKCSDIKTVCSKVRLLSFRCPTPSDKQKLLGVKLDFKSCGSSLKVKLHITLWQRPDVYAIGFVGPGGGFLSFKTKL